MLGIVALSGYAATPLQGLLQAFDGRYNNTQGVTTRENTQPGNYYYSVEAENNPAVAGQLLKWFEEIEKNSDNKTKTVSNGETRIILNLPQSITVGATYTSELKKMRIFIQSNSPL